MWLYSHTKGPCEYHMKSQELSSKAPAAGLLPLLKGIPPDASPLTLRSRHLLRLHWGVYYGADSVTNCDP